MNLVPIFMVGSTTIFLLYLNFNIVVETIIPCLSNCDLEGKMASYFFLLSFIFTQTLMLIGAWPH